MGEELYLLPHFTYLYEEEMTMGFFSLKGKNAVVTGAGSGLGYATAKRFKEAGANVTMADINEKSIDLANELDCYFVKT